MTGSIPARTAPRLALRLALRLERAGLLICTLLAVGLAFASAASFSSMAGDTVTERAAFARQAERLAPRASILLPRPERVDTHGGFVQWRVFGGLPFFLAGWALLSGAAATRGDEASGRLDHWLATGVTRAGWLATRALGFALAAAVVAGLAGLAAGLGAALSGGTLAAHGLVAMSLALWALTLSCYAAALLAGQVAGSRPGTIALGGALLAALHLLNAVPRGQGTVTPWRWLSPFYLYERSNALVPGGRADWLAILGLLAGAALIGVGAGWAFGRRDLGAALMKRHPRARPATRMPSRRRVWRGAVLAALYQQRSLVLGWTAAAAVLAQALTTMARPVADILLNSPATRGSTQLLSHGDPTQALVGYFLFGALQLLIALYAILQAGAWASEDAAGRLEMRLSAPVSRRRVVLERGQALTLALTVIATFGTASGLHGARVQGIPVPIGAAASGALALLPFGLSFGGIGALLAGLRPRLAVIGLGAFAAVSFSLLEFGILFGWPGWLIRLSVFDLYGAPLIDGLDWSGLAILALLSILSFAAAILALERRDVGR